MKGGGGGGLGVKFVFCCWVVGRITLFFLLSFLGGILSGLQVYSSFGALF